MIADLALIDGNVKAQAARIWPQTLVKAQRYNLQLMKEVDDDYMPHCYYGDHWVRILMGRTFQDLETHTLR